MLGVKETALKKALEKWQKRINRMIKRLNTALNSAEDLETNKTEKACLGNLKRLKKEIEKEIQQHKHGTYME